MSIAPEPKCCPKCGGPIPAEAPQGLCPKCLLRQVSIPTEAGQGDSSKMTPPPHNELAAAFPQLEILELIGQGGMGFAFKARQPKLDRLVALKILPQSLAADPAFAERFRREGRVLARLNHPNIVTIHDFGQANSFFYLLMELVDGVNLRQAMNVGRFTPAQALAVVPKICEALQFAHNEGILHRDIKPENILLDSKGRVKIADFGIAKLVAVETETLRPSLACPMGEAGALALGDDKSRPANLTETGKALGTAQYMAPEQIEHPQDVDQRADIYSLGVVFYEMLTGELPIGRFAPPSEKSAVDPRMDEVVLRALEKERERRTQTAREVRTQVETIVMTPQPGGSRRAEPDITSPKPRQDWWTWSPLQSREAGEICAHVTKAERNHLSLLVLLNAVWMAGTIVGIPAFIRSNSGPGKWIVASVWLILFAVSIPMLQRLMRHFLCSTTWSKARGLRPDQLRLFSFDRANLWKVAAILAVGVTLVLAQHKAMTSYLGLSDLMTQPVQIETIPVRQKRAISQPAFEPAVGVLQSGLAKTVVLTGATNELLNATNYLRVVRVHTDSPLWPGETLAASTKLSDGQMGGATTSFFINRRGQSAQTSSHFSWSLPNAFAPDDFESAARQLREDKTDRPLELLPGKPIELFSVTNRLGVVASGYLKFERAEPEPASASAAAGQKAQASIRFRPYSGGLLAFYTATVPPGYFLEATDNSADLGEGQASTSFSDRAGRHSSWFAPRSFTFEQQREGGAQLQRLAEQGPVQVLSGEPRQMFAITNKAGEVYRGFLELVGPPAPANP